MAITLSGSTGVTYPAGGLDNVAGAGVGTTDTQTLTNKTLTSPAVNSPTIGGTPVMSASVITSGTAVASTSGTAILFTGIPSWVKRVTVMFKGVGTSGGTAFLIQIGSGSITTSGYISTANGTNQSNATGGLSSTAGFALRGGSTVSVLSVITLITANTYVNGMTGKQGTTEAQFGAGDVTLGGALDRVNITTTTGTDTFNAGSINILYE